jgi:hypothetical protein
MQITQSVLREYLKRVQDAGAQAAANANANANSAPAKPGADVTPSSKRHPPLPPLPPTPSSVPPIPPKPQPSAVPPSAGGDNALSAALGKLTISAIEPKDSKEVKSAGLGAGDASPQSPLTHVCSLCAAAKDKPITLDCKHVVGVVRCALPPSFDKCVYVCCVCSAVPRVCTITSRIWWVRRRLWA